MSVINFSDHAAHFFIKAPCGQIMYIAAAEKTVQFPFPRGLTHLCKDASTQAHMLVRRQQVQRIEAKRKVLIATVACRAIAEIA